MGKSTKPKEKVVKEVELDAKVESDEIDNLEERMDKLQKELDDNLDALYKDLTDMRDKINKAMERLGLEAL